LIGWIEKRTEVGIGGHGAEVRRKSLGDEGLRLEVRGGSGKDEG